MHNDDDHGGDDCEGGMIRLNLLSTYHLPLTNGSGECEYYANKSRKGYYVNYNRYKQKLVLFQLIFIDLLMDPQVYRLGSFCFFLVLPLFTIWFYRSYVIQDSVHQGVKSRSQSLHGWIFYRNFRNSNRENVNKFSVTRNHMRYISL